MNEHTANYSNYYYGSKFEISAIAMVFIGKIMYLQFQACITLTHT